jgi:hypothetical protein
VCLGNVVECHDAVAESEEEVCAKGNNGPEGKLQSKGIGQSVFTLRVETGGLTYVWYYFVLDLCGERCVAQEESDVDLSDSKLVGMRMFWIGGSVRL